MRTFQTFFRIVASQSPAQVWIAFQFVVLLRSHSLVLPAETWVLILVLALRLGR